VPVALPLDSTRETGTRHPERHGCAANPDRRSDGFLTRPVRAADFGVLQALKEARRRATSPPWYEAELPCPPFKLTLIAAASRTCA